MHQIISINITVYSVYLSSLICLLNRIITLQIYVWHTQTQPTKVNKENFLKAKAKYEGTNLDKLISEEDSA